MVPDAQPFDAHPAPAPAPDAGVSAGVDVPAVLVEGLAYAYPDGTQVLFGIDLEVAAGERVALLGPNGAGKTTLALHLNGVLAGSGPSGGHGTTAGRIVVAGVPVAGPEADDARRRESRRRVGIVFQDSDDQLFLPTVRDDVAFGPSNLGLRGADLTARVTEALTTVDALDLVDRVPHHLSHGQRRRVALAGVLAMRPDVLVLDEPTSGLDPVARRELAELLQGLAMTVLLITHDLPFAAQTCSRAVLMRDGTITTTGPVGEVLADPNLLRQHRLELPWGFDTAVLREPGNAPQ